jgi:hypothetical protein
VALVYTASQGRLWAIGLKLLLVCVVGTLGVGCPRPIQYQPNDRLIETMGVSQAQKRLTEVLFRSINPRVTSVEVTDDFLHYRYQVPLIGPFGAQVGSTMSENRVFFVNVSRVEVFANNLVFLRTSAEQIIAQVVFGNIEDAQTFADLVLSFRTARRAG